MMDRQFYNKMRVANFSADYSMPDELINVAKTEKSHGFLTNPTALLCYIYLINYVKNLAETHFPNQQPLRILDWGCGKGQISYLVKQAMPSASLTSCDVSGDLAKDDSTFGQRTPIIDAFDIQIVPLTHPYELPFANESFDIVLSIGVLEHVPNDQASLIEINRILRPGGLFFCAFLPYTFSWTQKLAHWMGDNYHDRLYNWDIVDNLLAGSRFTLIDRWHRALLPKNPVNFPLYKQFEQLDQWLCEHTPTKYLATNIEFVARKE